MPEVGYKSAPFASFDTIVNSVDSVIKGNPTLAMKFNWPQSREDVARWVDLYNALVCQQNGWTDYITGDGLNSPPPKYTAPSPEDESRMAAAAGRVKKIWSGVKTLNEWIDSGQPAVPPETAARRARICADCPENGKGDFTTWFTAPAAAAIARQVEKLSQRKLTTPYDDRINVCNVCLCPLKLKVHTPVHFLAAHINPEVRWDLEKVPGCWIIHELGVGVKA